MAQARCYGALLGLMLVSVIPVHAGDNGFPDDPFTGELDNPTQEAIANGIFEVCINLPSSGGSSELADLRTVCSNMIETARQFVNIPGPGVGDGSVIEGIDSLEAMGSAFQQVGAEEQAATGTNGVKTVRGRALLSRLADVRGGAAGVSISDLRFGIGGRQISVTTLAASMNPGSLDVSGRTNATNTFSAGRSDRSDIDTGLFESERWGGFVNGSFGFGSQDATQRENGLDFKVPGVTAGVDYRFGTAFVLGGALSYEQFRGDYDTSPDVTGGQLDTDHFAASVYGSYNADKYYFDGYVSYGWNDYETKRVIVFPSVNREARSETDGKQHEVTGTVGYNGTRGVTQFTPYVRASRISIDIDGFTETGAAGLNLVIEDQAIDSLVSVVGAQLAWNFSGRAILTPHVRGEWYHEFDDDSRTIVARYAADPLQLPFAVGTDEPDQDYFSLGAGLACLWKGGTQAFFDLESLVGLQDVTSYRATAGVRWAF